MRILIATSHRELVGGVEKYLQVVIPAIERRGHSVGLLYEHACGDVRQTIDSGAVALTTWCSSELSRESLRSSLKHWSPDVVYSQGLSDGALESELLDSHPVVLYAHTYHGTCISGVKSHVRPSFQPCSRELGAGCLLRYHALGCGGKHPVTAWRMFQQQVKRKHSFPDYRAILVASRHMYREFSRHGVQDSQLHLVPLFATDVTPLAQEPPPRSHEGHLLFVGRVMHVKGIFYLLRAIPLAQKDLGRALHLTIAGDGPDRQGAEDLASRLGLNVEFAGWVDAEIRSDLMRGAGLLVVPSLWPEPFGLVGIEAGCHGAPAVAFDVGGIPDWLVDGQSGELAPGHPPTIEGLAGAIVRALSDEAHYQDLRHGARRISNQFNLDRHVVELERVLSLGPSAAPVSPSHLLPTNA